MSLFLNVPLFADIQMEPTGQQTAQEHPKMSIKVNRNLHYRHFLESIADIGEWL